MELSDFVLLRYRSKPHQFSTVFITSSYLAHDTSQPFFLGFFEGIRGCTSCMFQALARFWTHALHDGGLKNVDISYL